MWMIMGLQDLLQNWSFYIDMNQSRNMQIIGMTPFSRSLVFKCHVFYYA